MKTLLWAVVFSFVILLLSGCNDEDEGRIGPTRAAMAIYADDDNISTGWFVYGDMFGNVMEQDGLRMNVIGGDTAWYFSNNGVGGLNYNRCDDEQHIESSGVTQCGGRLIVHGKRDQFKLGYVIRSGLAVNKPNSPSTTATFGYKTQFSDRLYQAARASGDSYAGYLPQVSENYESASSNDGLTNDENIAVSNITDMPPASGIELVSCSLVSQSGQLGNHVARPVTSLFAVNIEDDSDFLKYAAPFTYSYIFKTAEPVDLFDKTFRATVKTDCCPDGVVVDLYIKASNSQMQTHVARTEYILPVSNLSPASQKDSVVVYDRWTGFDDPNIWDDDQYYREVKDDWLDCIDPNLYADPNIVPDPNVLFNPANPDLFDFHNRLDTSDELFEQILIEERLIDVKVVPMYDDDDYIRIVFNDKDPMTILQFTEAWLSDRRSLDLNNDGIVNLQDIHYRE